MTEAAPHIDPNAVPIWARDTAFPEAPAGWGWVDPKDRRSSCGSFEALAETIRQDSASRICLVWTPENPRMVLPEEVVSLREPVNLARSRWIGADSEDSAGKLRWGLLVFAALFSWTFYRSLAVRSGNSFSRLDQFRLALKETLNNNTIEIGFLILVIFVLIPWYQARKSSAEFRKRTPFSLAEAIPRMRFEIWLERQKAPFTWMFLGLMAIVGLAQLLPGDASTTAGLVKANYLSGEHWRLFTAPFLHGNPIHFIMNAAALLYLGKRLEVFARWPHLPMVFLFSAICGNYASIYFRASLEVPSVGASGGLMGWLGFLLVFETLHARLVPRTARRRLAGAVFLTALIGLLGHRFIDNAAHAGGLFAGMLYAAIVFPKSSSVYRPQATSTDRITGSLALTACIAAAAFTIWKIAAA